MTMCQLVQCTRLRAIDPCGTTPSVGIVRIQIGYGLDINKKETFVR